MLIIFSPTSQSHTAFMLVTVERGDGVAVHDVRTGIYASPSEWQTQCTLHVGGNQGRDTVGRIPNYYQRCAGFTSMSEYWLSQLMISCTYSFLLEKFRHSFSKQNSTASNHIFLLCCPGWLFCNAELLTASLNKHTPGDRRTAIITATKCTILIKL